LANPTLVYDGRIIRLQLETVKLPNGVEVELEMVKHPGGACVAAVNDADQACLLRQYRYATNGWIWELPAGKIDAAESPLVTAKRELSEEAHIRAGTWQPLGTMWSTPGFCDEILHLFLAQDIQPARATPDPHELIEVHWVPITRALDMAITGEIADAKSIACLFRAAIKLRQIQAPASDAGSPPALARHPGKPASRSG